MKKNGWIKVVVTIIILELVVGGIIFAYKKLSSKTSDDSISVKDELVVKLYNEIAYFDLDEIDVMSPSVILYYGYNNLETKESINCEVVSVTDDTTGYSCNGIADFVKTNTLDEQVKEIYGPKIDITKTSFQLSPNDYVFYDEVNDGFVHFTKDEKVEETVVNLNLKEATKVDDKIILTIEVLDGVLGTVNNTYKYTFEQDGENYYLITKELVAS